MATTAAKFATLNLGSNINGDRAGDHVRPRGGELEATGGNRGKFPHTEFGGGIETYSRTTPPGPLRLRSFWQTWYSSSVSEFLYLLALINIIMYVSYMLLILFCISSLALYKQCYIYIFQMILAKKKRLGAVRLPCPSRAFRAYPTRSETPYR